MNTLNSYKKQTHFHGTHEHTKGTLQHDTAHVHLCKQRMYWELCTGEFTGGGTPLSGAAVRKPVW